MRVKRLDLLGFKSFANKTTIHFEPGVTAIVGPNGSGKSNIVDAIRWVLGEHNPRDVRAPRLEDVIFNGTDQKAPLSMAEVQLTIANEQGLLPIGFTEVAIMRRVYRSGESECFINQSPCRLKDIQELFLGTGLGGGTYAIIEQGHIDLVLSSKPEERRIVFEEASGVAKYLAKKKETQRRLDEVEEHLVRLADIIGEVRRQVGALERQATKARQYKTQWEQLKQLEVRLAVDELRQGAAHHGELEHQVQALTAQRQALQDTKGRYVASLEERNAAVSAMQVKLQEARTRVVERASQIEQHESQFTLKTRWVDELKQQAKQVELEATQLRTRAGSFDEELARISGGGAELQAQLTTIQAQVEEGVRGLAAVEATLSAALQTISQAKAQAFETASDASHQRNQVAEITSRLQAIEAQAGRLDGQRTQLTVRAEDLRARREAAGHEEEALRTSAEDIRQRVRQMQQTLDAAAARRHEQMGRLRQMREHVASERAKITVLEELWRRYEGFPEAVKALVDASIDGVIGPLADLLQAVPGYEAVVEAALGPLSDALVVRDRRTLARCREVVSAQHVESCRFLVLADCPSSPVAADGMAAHAGTMGAVKQFVRTEARYQPLVEWLLDDSWMVDNFDRLLGDRAIPPYRLVSAQGDRWDRRSWRLAGASAAHRGAAGGDGGASRRIGRKQRWQEAATSLQALEQQANALEADAKQADDEWQSWLAQLEAAKGELAHVTPSVQKIEAHAQQLMRESQRLGEEQRALDLERQDLATQREELRAAQASAERAANEAHTRQQAVERALADAQSAREAAEQRKQQLLLARAHIDATVQSLTDRIGALQARGQELDSERTHLHGQVDAKLRQRDDTGVRVRDLEEQLQMHQREREQQQAQRSVLETEAERLAGAVRTEEAQRDEVVPKLLDVEQQLSALIQQIQEHSQQLSERTFRRTRILERLRELYQIDDATLEAERQAEASALSGEQRAELAAQVQKLRAKLEGMGPVSLGSVEEYDELKRRLEFLQTQERDLVQSRDDLKASITQINRTARAQFRETFARITQEFKHYYTRLFDGGEANLILLDEEDVLESGIDIVARPPGKRLQSISLLSGGERALTAIALLFALFKVRPSPFCVLDEIDAPLDEANVDRFTRVLEEFLSLSQFILITHNKKTITKADSLYGVTMEEAGISRILSAKLASSAPTLAPVA